MSGAELCDKDQQMIIHGADRNHRSKQAFSFHAAKWLLGAAALTVAIIAPLTFGLAAAQQNAAPPNEAEQRAQQAARFGSEMKFDVASIRPSGPTARFGGQFLPDGFTFRGTSLQGLFANSYGTPDYLIIGKPDWWSTEKYDVLAKTDGAVAEKLQKLTQAERGVARDWMIEELLADRFKLKVHWETQQLPRYVMTVAKRGLKIKEAPAGEDYGHFGAGGRGRSRAGFIMSTKPGETMFNGVTITRLADSLGRALKRPVADETGLTGKYDLVLRQAPTSREIENMEGPAAAAPPAAPNGQPALAAADPYVYGPLSPESIEKQLGLHLELKSGPVRVLVIDHVEKPSAD